MFDQARYEFRGAQTVTTASHGSDANLFVEFYEDAVHLEAQSREENRPIYEDRVFIRIMVPGGKSTVVREARLERGDNGEIPDHERFPLQWAQFKSQQEQVGDGTPLSEWSYLSKSQVMELKAMKIHTVDQLAAQSDASLSHMGLGALDLRNRARAFLDQASGGEVLSKLQKELEDARHEIAAMKASLEALGADTESKRGPGRPKKETNHVSD